MTAMHFRIYLADFFSSLGLEFLGVFNVAAVVYHVRPGQLVSDFNFDLMFQISGPDFRFQISVLMFRVSSFRFQIPYLRF